MTSSSLAHYAHMRMRYHPRYIVFWAASRYMTETQIEIFRQDIGKISRVSVVRFVAELNKHFSLDTMLKNPQIREDAWIYNYLMYDCRKGFVRTKLIKRYEKEVVLPVERKFRELIEGLA